MRYVLSIYLDEALEASKSKEELDQEMAGYYAFTEAVQSAGICVASEALHPTSTATTVRLRDGKTLTTDGPFAETKECLGGFYLLECKNLDEAIQWAAKIPSAKDGSVEIRPVIDFSQTASA